MAATITTVLWRRSAVPVLRAAETRATTVARITTTLSNRTKIERLHLSASDRCELHDPRFDIRIAAIGVKLVMLASVRHGGRERERSSEGEGNERMHVECVSDSRLSCVLFEKSDDAYRLAIAFGMNNDTRECGRSFLPVEDEEEEKAERSRCMHTF